LAKDSEIVFQFLVNSLRLAISLGIMGSGEGGIVGEELSKFPGKGRGELWTTV